MCSIGAINNLIAEQQQDIGPARFLLRTINDVTGGIYANITLVEDRFYVFDGQNTVVLNACTLEEISKMPLERGCPCKWAYRREGDNDVQYELGSHQLIISVVGSAVSQTIALPPSTYSYSFGPFCERGLVVKCSSNVVYIDTQTGELLQFNNGSYIHWIILSADGRRLYLGDANNQVLELDLKTMGQVRPCLRLSGATRAFTDSAALSPDGTRLCVAVRGLNRIDIIDTTRWAVENGMEAYYLPNILGFSGLPGQERLFYSSTSMSRVICVAEIGPEARTTHCLQMPEDTHMFLCPAAHRVVAIGTTTVVVSTDTLAPVSATTLPLTGVTAIVDRSESNEDSLVFITAGVKGYVGRLSL